MEANGTGQVQKYLGDPQFNNGDHAGKSKLKSKSTAFLFSTI